MKQELSLKLYLLLFIITLSVSLYSQVAFIDYYSFGHGQAEINSFNRGIDNQFNVGCYEVTTDPDNNLIISPGAFTINGNGDVISSIFFEESELVYASSGVEDNGDALIFSFQDNHILLKTITITGITTVVGDSLPEFFNGLYPGKFCKVDDAQWLLTVQNIDHTIQYLLLVDTEGHIIWTNQYAWTGYIYDVLKINSNRYFVSGDGKLLVVDGEGNSVFQTTFISTIPQSSRATKNTQNEEVIITVIDSSYTAHLFSYQDNTLNEFLTLPGFTSLLINVLADGNQLIYGESHIENGQMASTLRKIERNGTLIWEYALPGNSRFGIWGNILLTDDDCYMAIYTSSFTWNEKFAIIKIGINGPLSVPNVPAPSCNISVCPNPFRNESNIQIDTKQSEKVSVDVFNIKGQLVKTLASNILLKQNTSFTWNGTDRQKHKVAQGVYFVKVNGNQKTWTKKIVLIK